MIGIVSYGSFLFQSLICHSCLQLGICVTCLVYWSIFIFLIYIILYKDLNEKYISIYETQKDSLIDEIKNKESEIDFLELVIDSLFIIEDDYNVINLNIKNKRDESIIFIDSLDKDSLFKFFSKRFYIPETQDRNYK